MKTKTLYAIVFFLAVIIIFTLIYSRSKLTELNQPMAKVIPAVEVRQSGTVTESVEPVFFSKRAISIIKPAQGKQAALSELDKVADVKEQQDSSLSSRNTSLAGGADSQNTEEAAGVTRLGKYPTPEETKEMNSKGIVMY